MTDNGDELATRRVLRGAFGSAAQALAEQLALGRLVWAVDGWRCYRRVREDGEDVMAVVGPDGGQIDLTYAGVDLDLL